MDAISDKVINIITKVLKVELGLIGPTSSGDTIEQWDSLAHATIIAKVEEVFVIKFDIMDMISMRTADDIIQKVRQIIK